jgi:hypothetical protein
MNESVRFVTQRTLVEEAGRVRCRSSFVDQDGAPMTWHDFGCLEGPGWAANAVGGAWELLLHARRSRDSAQEHLALGLVDHVLEDGFINTETGLITAYRDTGTGVLCHNYAHGNEWLCPGSMARVACQMLALSDHLDPRRRDALRRGAAGAASWLRRLPDASNGWYPRRCTPGGEPFADRPGGGPDPLAEASADSLFIVQLLTELSSRALGSDQALIRRKLGVFITAGGIFGSINHDTFDEHECVSYAAGFRVLTRAAALLKDSGLREFAYVHCLAGLDQFRMREDRNGVATTGLLFMERSWDTAYLWENAEAAAAYLEAFFDTGDARYRARATEILQAIAGHHHGPHGFLTEGVDWNNHVGAEHHFDGALYGDIRYTEPLLNNLHIVEPTLLLLGSG